MSAHAPLPPEAIETLRPLVRRLREIQGVAEARPGVLQLRGKPFVTLRAEASGLVAEILKPGGSGTDRMPIDTAPQQRTLVDAATLRARRLDGDD
jgi:hypothetical protein